MNDNDTNENSTNYFTKFVLRSDVIEISGSEDFVTKQIDLIKDTILKRLDQLSIEKSPLNTSSGETKLFITEPLAPPPDVIEYVPKLKGNEGLTSADFENVILIRDTQVTIIADIPGNSTSQRMINLILLYLWGKLQINIEEVSFKELRDMCEKYGEVDKTNFSKILNSQKKLFLIGRTTGDQSVRLIRPGIKIAEKIIVELNTKP